MKDVELKRKLQLLKGSNGEYVLSTITDVYALIDFCQEVAREAQRTILQTVFIPGELDDDKATSDMKAHTVYEHVEKVLSELTQILNQLKRRRGNE